MTAQPYTDEEVKSMRGNESKIRQTARTTRRLIATIEAKDAEIEKLKLAAGEYIHTLEFFWGIPDRVEQNPVTKKAREDWERFAKQHNIIQEHT